MGRKDFQHIPDLSPGHAVSLLHIALNAPSTKARTVQPSDSPDGCAAELLRWLLQDSGTARYSEARAQAWQQHAAAMENLQQHVSQPEILHQLLQTAVLRRHEEATGLLCRLPALPLLSVNDVTGLITSLVSVLRGDYLDCLGRIHPKTSMLSVLCQQLPAAKQLDVSSVTHMMQRLVDRGLDSTDPTTRFRTHRKLLAILLEHVPEAQQLPVACVTDMMHKVVKHLNTNEEWFEQKDKLLRLLVALPAAQQIPQQTAEDIVLSCLQQHASYVFLAEPMQQLGVASVLSILYDAADCDGLTPQMLNHPAAQQLSSDDLEQLLLTLLAARGDASIALLCQHAVAAKLSPAAIGRLLATTVQISTRITAKESIFSLIRIDASVTMDDLMPAIRAAVCLQSTTSLRALVEKIHAISPDVSGQHILPEALRTTVLLRLVSQLRGVWEVSSSLGSRSEQHAEQEQVAAVAVAAVACGSFPDIQWLLGNVKVGSSVKVWQQLLALALLVRDPQAAQMLAGECFRQQQVNEPWLPEMMRVATSVGSQGYAAWIRQELNSAATSTAAGPHAMAGPAVAAPTDWNQLLPLYRQYMSSLTPASQEWASQQSQQQFLRPREAELQQLLQLQGPEQRLFSEQCLQKVAGLMAAATRGTAANTIMAATPAASSCWDARTGSFPIVSASVLQLMRSKADPESLQLFGSALERLESIAFAKTAALWFGELLQVAVAASNGYACGLLCNNWRLCKHLSQQQVMNVLILAVLILHYSPHTQRQQALLAMQHVCRLFTRLSDASSAHLADVFSGAAQTSVAPPEGGSSTMATRACVRQVLMFAVRSNNEANLRELLDLIPAQKLLSYTDLYILQLSALQGCCSPRILEMLCAIRPCQHSDEPPASAPVSVAKLVNLFEAALGAYSSASSGAGKTGAAQVVQLLADWEPCWAGQEPSDVCLASWFSDTVLDDLCKLAEKVADADERVLVLEVLYDVGGDDFRAWRERRAMPPPVLQPHQVQAPFVVPVVNLV